MINRSFLPLLWAMALLFVTFSAAATMPRDIIVSWESRDSVASIGYDKAYQKMLASLTSARKTAFLAGLVSGTAQDNYYTAAAALRAQHIEPYANTIKQFVFAKHVVLGGYHVAGFYPVTESQTDWQTLYPFGPDGYKDLWWPNTQLCLFTLQGTIGKIDTLLKDTAGMIRDPEVSYDGKKILFSWKKSLYNDDFHLYEMEAATKKIRQLTSGKGYADIEAIYTPNGDIMFNSTRCVIGLPCWWTPVMNLFVMDSVGRFMRQLGFDQAYTNFPAVLANGSIEYLRWDYNDRDRVFPHALFSMNPDGTNQVEYYGNNSTFPTSIMHARPIPNSNKLVGLIGGYHVDQSGKLGLVDNTLAHNCPLSAPDAGPYGVQLIAPVRPTPPVANDIYGCDGEQFAYPYPVSDTVFLACWAPSVTRQAFQNTKEFKIYLVTSGGSKELLVSDSTTCCMQPVIFAPRPRPTVLASRVDYRLKYGTFSMVNIYKGEALKGVAPGTIKKLRIVALEYRHMVLGSNWTGETDVTSPVGFHTLWDVKKVLGETPVYQDGSAAFYVPARVPVYFQALDSNNCMVQSMRSWATLMPGEELSCVGCHENKMVAPEPPAQTPIAFKIGPQKLTPFYGDTGGFSFPRMIQPILDKNCIKCHNGTDTTLDLRANPIYESNEKKWYNSSYIKLVTQIGKYVTPINFLSAPEMLTPASVGAAKSPLILKLRSGKMGSSTVLLTKEEMDKLCCWIDLCVPHAGDYTEGMNAQDKLAYDVFRTKRTTWQAEELKNIQSLLDAQYGPGFTPFSVDNTLRVKAQKAARITTSEPLSFRALCASPSMKISFSLPFAKSHQHLRLALYDMRGELVTVLANASAGNGDYDIFWNGRDSHGKKAGAGVMLVKLTYGNVVASKSVTYVR